MKSVILTLLMALIVSTINAAAIVPVNNNLQKRCHTAPHNYYGTAKSPFKNCWDAPITKTIPSGYTAITSTKTTSTKTIPTSTTTTSTKTIPTSTTTTSTKTIPTSTTTTTTTTKKVCPTNGYRLRIGMECNNLGGVIYAKDDGNCGYDYVCFIPCTKNIVTTTTSKIVPKATSTNSKTIVNTTKTVPRSTTTSSSKSLPSNKSVEIDGNYYCLCKINDEIVSDISKCEEVASQYGYVKSTDVTDTCIPVTLTVTKKVKETITKKETVTVTVTVPTPDAQCAAKYAQCGGIGYNGPTCCQSGTCQKLSDYYSQCM